MIRNKRGFSLIELVAVMAISATLFGLVVFNLVGTQKASEIGAACDTLVTDMASQQTKAMLGAGTSSGTNYGIHFQSDRYILFQGNTYNPSDSNNFTITIDSGLSFTNILFPNGNLVFSSTSGTVSGYLNGSNYVILKDTQGSKSKTVTVNRYGVVTQEN